MPELTDAQRASARRKLTAALKKMKKVMSFPSLEAPCSQEQQHWSAADTCRPPLPNVVIAVSPGTHSSQVELQVVLIDELFANVEQSEYELFNMGRGPYAGKKAGAIQTNDDAKEEECQTEEVSGAGDGGGEPALGPVDYH